MVLPYINMNPSQVYTYFHPEPPSLLPPCTIPLGHLSAPAPSIQYHASNLNWRFISYMVLYLFQFVFSQIIPLSPSSTESKRLFFTSVSLLLSHIPGYRYHLSKFHIYALVYCIGVFLSGLLHSVYSIQKAFFGLKISSRKTHWIPPGASLNPYPQSRPFCYPTLGPQSQLMTFPST